MIMPNGPIPSETLPPPGLARPPALSLAPGQSLAQHFVVRLPFHSVSRQGTRFLTCQLEAEGLLLRGYAWADECAGFYVPRHGERVYVEGRVRWRNERLELVCRLLKPEDVAERIRWARLRMRQLLHGLEPEVLRQFLGRVFHDPRIGPAFLVAPASLNHHHAFSGGLLVHSAETAWWVYCWSEDLPHRGLAITAAMLHDIGKVRTLRGDRTRTQLGQAVRHEDLTLEVLAEPLCWLDGVWPQGAILLRHLLTAQPRQQASSPAYTALELVRAADRISAREQLPATGSERPAAKP